MRSKLSLLILMSFASASAFAANPPLDYSAIAQKDADLSERINSQLLEDPSLSRQDWKGLAVSVKDGSVYISGRVTTDAALKEVMKVAKRNSDNVIYNVQTDEENQGLHN